MSQVLAVAKEFVRLALAGEEPDPLTTFRLQKLLYYAQAWSLVIRASELFSDAIEAGRLGPVLPAVRQALPPDLASDQVSAEAFATAPALPADDAEFVRRVWEAYSPYSALQLSRMTRQELPWRKIREGPPDGVGGEIPSEDLEAFFAAQAVPAPLAAYGHELRKREAEALRQLAAWPQLDAHRLMAAVTSRTPAADLRLAQGD
jgi:uncharacterized phage-associated protein